MVVKPFEVTSNDRNERILSKLAKKHKPTFHQVGQFKFFIEKKNSFK
jgi:hypothetical protein